jgi:UDP:flavonoid glycosyltransferase YjiC (YdhE family)
VTIIQADLHPTNKGFIWWKEAPRDIPSPVSVLNVVLAEYAMDPISDATELLVGDLTLCAGTPDTDPVPEASDVVHLGPMFIPQMDAELPAWVDDFAAGRPLIWVYCGNPRYVAPGFPGPTDSIVIMRAAIEGLAGEDLSVLLTAGFQERPEELPPLPDNFREAAYLPGLSLARRCDLMVHHGGHGSCMTSAFSGTPALIVPTYSERESNARRLADLGAAGMHVPGVDETGEKHVDGAEFARTVQAMLAEPSYRRQAEALSARMKPSAGAAGIAQRIEELL